LVDPREAPPDRIAEHLGRAARLLETLLRYVRLQRVQQDAAARLVLDAAQEPAQDAEAGRHDPARGAGMHAFTQHLDGERADEVAAQRGRAPELLVIAALGVQADHQARGTDALFERLDVVRQVEAAALFAALDEHDTTRVRNALLTQCPDGGERAEHRVPVVGAAAAVKLAVAAHGLPRAEPF